MTESQASVDVAAVPATYGQEWIVGTVTRKLHGCFIINHDVFCHKSAYEGDGDCKDWFETLEVGDPVNFIANEHQQGRNKWRANRVKNVPGYSRPPRTQSPAPRARKNSLSPNTHSYHHVTYQPVPAPQYAPMAYPYPYPQPYPYQPAYSPPAYGYAPMGPPSSPPAYPYHYPPYASPPPGAFSSPYSDHHSPMPPHLSPMLYFLKPSPYPAHTLSPSEMARPLSPNHAAVMAGIVPDTSRSGQSESVSDHASDTDQSECTNDSSIPHPAVVAKTAPRSLLECSIAAYRAALREYWADGDEEKLMERIHKEGAVYGWEIHFLSTLFQLTCQESSRTDTTTFPRSLALVAALVSANTMSPTNVRMAWEAAIRSDVFAGEPAEAHQIAGDLLGHALHTKLIERSDLTTILAPLNSSGAALAVALAALKTLVGLTKTPDAQSDPPTAPEAAGEDLAVLLQSMGMGGEKGLKTGDAKTAVL